jgi:pyrroloquinoline-quinone synthase
MKTKSQTRSAARVTRRADEILARCQIMDNPYFATLREGRMPLECFQRTQEQFYFAVVFFAQPMAALVARIPNPRQRLDILHNVVEEHGEFNSREFHETTFKRFLRSIRCRPEKLDDLELWPEVRAFNSVLATACLHDQIETGIACMGIIEYAFADISALIGGSVTRLGWVRPDRLVHYKLHAQIDKRHAREFFEIVEPLWQDRRRRYYIDQGLQLGAYVFDRLYRDLFAKSMAAVHD